MPGKHHRHSPNTEHERKHKKHKHKEKSRASRSRSPYHDQPTSRHRRREENSPSRPQRHVGGSRHPHIKQEPEDRGYERSANREDTSDQYRQQQRERRMHDQRRREKRRQNVGTNPFESSDSQSQYGAQNTEAAAGQSGESQERDKPNFELSGKLTEDTNTYRGVVIKYNEPPEARKSKKKWRWYPFKDDEPLPILHLHRQSAFLLGRDRRVADIPVDHPSCSKQHAVLQFRLVPFERADGTTGRRVCPYIIDLGSANGTFVNNKRIDSERYVQLFEKDMVKFGFSSREYVLLHDKTDTSELHDDDGEEDSD